MRADKANIIALIYLVLVTGAFAYVCNGYLDARRSALESRHAARIAQIQNSNLLRLAVEEAQPDDYVPPAPIIHPFY